MFMILTSLSIIRPSVLLRLHASFNIFFWWQIYIQSISETIWSHVSLLCSPPRLKQANTSRVLWPLAVRCVASIIIILYLEEMTRTVSLCRSLELFSSRSNSHPVSISTALRLIVDVELKFGHHFRRLAINRRTSSIHMHLVGDIVIKPPLTQIHCHRIVFISTEVFHSWDFFLRIFERLWQAATKLLYLWRPEL